MACNDSTDHARSAPAKMNVPWLTGVDERNRRLHLQSGGYGNLAASILVI
jgi:hypothetical protein